MSLSGEASADPGGSIVDYAWDFGDGATGGGAAVQHVFTAPGYYTVTLTIPSEAAAGIYSIIAVADDGKAVVETNEANNTRSKAITIQ